MPKKITTLLILFAFSFLGVAGCSREEGKNESVQGEKITIAVTPWPASAALYIAQEKGYFREEGLDPTLTSYISGHLALDAVLSGKADLGAAADTPIARAAVDGKPLAVLATLSEIDQGILIIARKDKGISVPDDLRGKKIGLVAGSAAEFFLHIYLTTSLINPKHARISDLAPDKVVDALLDGEVDGVVTWAPHTLVLREKLGGKAVIFHDPNIYTLTWNAFATQDFVKSHPERTKKFLRALVRANRFIAEQPVQARGICAKNIGTDSSLLEKEWQDYRFIAALDQSLILNLEDQARWMVKREASHPRRPPNFMDFIHSDALKAVQPEAVSIVGR